MAKSVWLGLGILFLLGGATPLFAQQPMQWDYVVPSLHSYKIQVKRYKVGCYYVSTGNPGKCYMSFKAYFDSSWVPPEDLVDYTGGHLHPLPDGNDPDRPVGSLTCPADPSSSPDGHSFQGPTKGQFWTATKGIPQVSGVVTIFAYYIVPYPWRFIPQLGWVTDNIPMGPSTTHTVIGFDVGLGGLEELPAMPNVYVRCGLTAGCTSDNPYNNPKHPKVFYGTPGLIHAIEGLANLFRLDHPNEKLRITDMSLPAGGLFDLDYNWDTAKGHKDHRVGTAVDISQSALLDSGGTKWLDQKLLNVLAGYCDLARYKGEKQIHFNYNIAVRPAF